MRTLNAVLAASAVFAIAAAPAVAATLTANGTLGLTIGAAPAVTVGGGPTDIFVSSGSGDFTQPANMFETTVVLPPQLFTGVPIIYSLSVAVANGTMTVSGGTGSVGLNGNATVAIISGILNLFIPLSLVGAGGVIQGGAASLMITVTGHNWTTGIGQITALTSATSLGGFTNTVSTTGFDARTAGHKGSILLVSPFRTITNAQGTLTGFATQLLTFVPEPGTLVLMGSAIAGLGLAGRRRMRK